MKTKKGGGGKEKQNKLENYFHSGESIYSILGLISWIWQYSWASLLWKHQSSLSKLFKHLPGARWRVYIVSAGYISSTVSDNFPPSHYPSLSLSIYLCPLYFLHKPTPPPPHPHPAPSSSRALASSSPIRLALAGSFCLLSNCPAVADWHVNRSNVRAA